MGAPNRAAASATPTSGDSPLPVWTLALLVAAFSVVVIGVGASRKLTGLEQGLVQFISLTISLVGSFVFGRKSSRAGAKALIQTQARPAFRRLVSLYAALQNVAGAIEARRQNLNELAHQSAGNVTIDHVNVSLDLVQALVLEHIRTANDAVEDWRDIAPSEVEQIERSIKEANQR